MNQANTAPSITGGLVSALCSLWRQKFSAAILFGFYLVVAGATIVAPFDLYVGLYDSILHDQTYRADQTPGDDLWGAFIIMAILGIVSGGVLMMLIGRLAALGPERMFEGGLPAFTRRALWVIWRFIEALILLAVASALFYLFLIVTDWLNGFISGVATWQSPLDILFIILASALIALSLLSIFAVVSLTIWAACQDRRVGLIEAWRALAGLRLRIMLTIFLMLLMTMLIALALIWLAVMLFPEPGSAQYVAGLIGLGMVDFLTGYLWLAVGGQYSKAVGLG